MWHFIVTKWEYGCFIVITIDSKQKKLKDSIWKNQQISQEPPINYDGCIMYFNKRNRLK